MLYTLAATSHFNDTCSSFRGNRVFAAIVKARYRLKSAHTAKIALRSLQRSRARSTSVCVAGEKRGGVKSETYVEILFGFRLWCGGCFYQQKVGTDFTEHETSTSFDLLFRLLPTFQHHWKVGCSSGTSCLVPNIGQHSKPVFCLCFVVFRRNLFVVQKWSFFWTASFSMTMISGLSAGPGECVTWERWSRRWTGIGA